MIGFLASWFLVSWFQGLLVSWFIGFLFLGFEFIDLWFLGFKVSEFQGFKNPSMLLKDIGSILPNFHFMFLSKIFKIFLEGSSGLIGARLFQTWQNCGCPETVKFMKRIF